MHNPASLGYTFETAISFEPRGCVMKDFISVNETNFEQKVLKSEIPILLEFGAPWCRPCKSLEPILSGLAERWEGQIEIARLNVDECVNLTMKYQVISVPTTILFASGEEKVRFIGLQKPDKIREQVASYLLF